MKNNNKGFSLVELIVVIAIMAILAAVAVVGFSMYIPKAQQASDKQMISDIEYALDLYYYSNPSEAKDGVLVLNVKDDAQSDTKFIIDAMKATYGEDWQNELALQYDGWNATFQGSSFYDEQHGFGELLGTVDTLTGALGTFLDKHSDKLNDGGAFANYVNNMAGADASIAAKSDAAVFYVAESVGKLGEDALQNAVGSLQTAKDSESALGAMNGALGGDSITSMATLYALAEGYATYYDKNYETPEGQESPRDILDGFNEEIDSVAGADDATTAKVFAELFNKFNEMGAVNDDALEAYMGTAMEQDLNAFNEAMKMASASKDDIVNANANNNMNLGEDGFFTTDYIQGLVTSYSEGGVFVYVKVEDEGLKISTSIDAE